MDKECEKIDGNIVRNDQPATVNLGHPKIKTKVDTSCNALCIVSHVYFGVIDKQ